MWGKLFMRLLTAYFLLCVCEIRSNPAPANEDSNEAPQALPLRDDKKERESIFDDKEEEEDEEEEEEGEEEDESLPWWQWLAIGLGVLLMIIIFVVCACCMRRSFNDRSGRYRAANIA